MTEHRRTAVTRRGFLKAGALAAATAPLLARAPFVSAQTRSTKVLDFQTGADVAKAEQEGEVVYYGHDEAMPRGESADEGVWDGPRSQRFVASR